MNEKARENRVRRQLAKQGYRLHKSRARGVHFDNRGGYMIIDACCNYIVAGEKCDLSLEDVERFAAD